jgi:hypothetical protein
VSRRGRTDRQRYTTALTRQHREGGRIWPERITAALDIRGLYGPQVDVDCGGREPMVDQWEAGTRTPTQDQLERLSLLTGFPIGFFYQPPPACGPFVGYICGRGGCEYVDMRPGAPVAPIVKDTLW